MDSTSSPAFALSTRPEAVDADLLVVPLFDAETLEGSPGLAQLDRASGRTLGRALTSRECSSAVYDQWWGTLDGSFAAPRLLVIGAGTRERWSVELVRRLGTAAGILARQRRLTRLAIWLRSLPDEAARVVQAATEGALLAQHDLGHLKSAPRPSPQLTAVTLAGDGLSASPALEQALHRGLVLGDCTNLARALGNEPSNVLTPTVLAERAQALAPASLRVEVLDEGAIRKRGMGLLLGVGQGSAEPPRVIVLDHRPPGAADGPVLGLVGKGITFDTGGISIKPAEGMDRMKVDMAGGAAVIGALRAASLLQAPIRVIGVIPTAENMPDGRAIKPGDVLRSASGNTVEVNNTDAEGRLLLGDGLWLARQLGATHLVDVATLTGACVVALGRVMAGLFGTPPSFLSAVQAVGERTGDRCWPMPTHDDYFDQLKSDVADMTNTGGRPGGAVTAAVFLKQFTGGLPWAHLDIAGVAWADDARPYQVKGATGAATRLLAELALAPGAWQRADTQP
jgi:leucyl aminopeptidase